MAPLHAHLALDPYPKERLIKPRKHLIAWLERMNTTPQDMGEWLPADEIPITLVPILQSQCQDQLHFIHKVMAKNHRMGGEKPNSKNITPIYWQS